MKARYYDPSLGRFASEDVAKDGSNWFVYVRNNPVTGLDKTGNIEGEDDEDEADGEAYVFMLATLTYKMFQVSLAVMFLATLTCILAPLAFVVCLPVPIAGLCLGASAAILTVQRMFAMMQAVSASSGFGGGIGMIEAKGSVVGPVYEVCTMIGGYGAGLYLIMEADDAYQELT